MNSGETAGMDTIQVALADMPYALALRDLLLRSGACEVVCVDCPDVDKIGVLVLDPEHLERLVSPIAHPERLVLVARDEPSFLSRAWDAGVTSVVYDKDPLSTVVLAIMAARLRTSRPRLSSPGELARPADADAGAGRPHGRGPAGKPGPS